MSRINGTNCFWTGRPTSLAEKYADTTDLEVLYVDTAPSIITPFAGSLITTPGRVRQFDCDMVIEAPADGFVRTTFYDTSGTPVGIEPVLWSILSFSSKSAGSTVGFQTHNLSFPGNGLYFKNGIGVICQRISGAPVIQAVASMIYYHAEGG